MVLLLFSEAFTWLVPVSWFPMLKPNKVYRSIFVVTLQVPRTIRSVLVKTNILSCQNGWKACEWEGNSYNSHSITLLVKVIKDNCWIMHKRDWKENLEQHYCLWLSSSVRLNVKHQPWSALICPRRTCTLADTYRCGFPFLNIRRIRNIEWMHDHFPGKCEASVFV